jgi:hypothetical protein
VLGMWTDTKMKEHIIGYMDRLARISKIKDESERNRMKNRFDKMFRELNDEIKKIQ